MRNESVSTSNTATFGLLTDLKAPIVVKINHLQYTGDANNNIVDLSTKFEDTLVFKQRSRILKHSDLYVRCTVYEGVTNKPISIGVQTPYKAFGSKGRVWNSYLKLPLYYNQVSIDSYLKFEIYEIVETRAQRFGVGFLSLFNKNSASLRKGSQKIPIYVNEDPPLAHDYDTKGLTEIEKCLIGYENGDYNRVEWVDNLVLPIISANKEVDRAYDYYLYFELPNFELPIVYLDISYYIKESVESSRIDIHPDIQTTVIMNSVDIPLSQGKLLKVHDPDFRTVNSSAQLDPIEMKYHKLERNVNNNSILDKELKPSPHVRDELIKILAKPSSMELSDVEKNLIWKYRYFFSKNNSISDANKMSALSTKSFLPKFLKSINWENDHELNHVFLEIIPNYWSVDRLQIGDALELLSSYFNPYTLASTIDDDEDKPAPLTKKKGSTSDEPRFVKIFKYVTFLRKFAVNRLRSAKSEELQLYLLQLVQALEYEALVYSKPLKHSSEPFQFVNELNNDADTLKSPLAKFLIEKSVENEHLGNFFYWYVKVENEDQLGSNGPPARMYTAILNKYIESLKKYSIAHKLPYYNNLKRQTWFIKKLTSLVELLRSTFKKNEATAKKKEFLKEYLSNPSNEMLKFPEPFPLPLDPSVIICGCYPEESSVFKSSLAPLKITFKTLTTQHSSSQLFGKKHNKYGKYSLMFKIGDDLRQDQLVIQIINLMDQLLKNENLDLKLTPYKILASSPVAGLIQFVPNETLDTVLANTYPTVESASAGDPNTRSNGILNYLRLHSTESTPTEPISRSVLNPLSNHTEPSVEQRPTIASDLGVSSVLMDNYVKSCAGYCVITYLLGVGDRHLDNLLLSPNGKFWHADFGYILGRDPKPFPPLMKLPIQVIDGMGGMDHENYNIFKNYCFITYTTLRKNSNLILNLFQLMLDANIPDIKIDPKRAIEKVEEKFCLEMTEEEAILHFQNLINDSVNAFLPMVIDRLHSLAQYWRA